MNKNMMNHRSNENYPVFVIPDTSYEIILINQYMSMKVMGNVLNHIKDCY